MWNHLTLAQKIGQLLVVGFLGTGSQDTEIKTLADHIAASRVGGVVAYMRNINSPEQIGDLNLFLANRAQAVGLPPLIRAVDQEGGKVQRLNSKNGFSDTFSAKDMTTKTLAEVASLYGQMAQNVRRAGFNWDFAPCVDLDIAGELGSAIGKWGRSYGEDVETVVSYGSTMIDALYSQGCLSCVKHYPGHGSAGKKTSEGQVVPKNSDTHLGFVDVTDVWEERELEPFYALGSKAGAVMTAHVINQNLDLENPATLSPQILGTLRTQCPDVVIVSDCLQMGAIQTMCGSFEEAVVRALSAGVDLIIYANNPTKSGQTSAPGFEPGPDFPERFVEAVQSGVRRGVLTEAQINEHFERVMKLKEKIS